MVSVGSVITVSPRDRIADLQRMAGARVKRDGVTQFAAVTADRMQLVRLRRLRGRLLASPGLDVFYGDRPDGMSYLTVYPAGDRSAGIFASQTAPKTIDLRLREVTPTTV
jgi:hypothetical protein